MAVTRWNNGYRLYAVEREYTVRPLCAQYDLLQTAIQSSHDNDADHFESKCGVTQVTIGKDHFFDSVVQVVVHSKRQRERRVRAVHILQSRGPMLSVQHPHFEVCKDLLRNLDAL